MGDKLTVTTQNLTSLRPFGPIAGGRRSTLRGWGFMHDRLKFAGLFARVVAWIALFRLVTLCRSKDCGGERQM